MDHERGCLEMPMMTVEDYDRAYDTEDQSGVYRCRRHGRLEGSRCYLCDPEPDEYDEDLALEDLRSELAVAIPQMLATDDQIICDHVRRAHQIVVQILDHR